MTRRLRLVSMLVALMALSGAYVAPTGSAYGRRLAAVLSIDAHRHETRTRRAQVAARGTEPEVRSVSELQVVTGRSVAVPLARFQRPPPSLV
jgi:hypothetical protein